MYKKIISYLSILLCFTLFFLICGVALAVNGQRSKAYIIKTTDRVEGIKLLLKKYDLPDLKGKKVVIKPNFNSDDDFPATTHIETLKAVIEQLKLAKPRSITIVERSGMGNTDSVLKNRGVIALAGAEKVDVINTDHLKKEDWVRKGKGTTHWLRGFLVPRVVLEADYVVNICNLKTHRFGGDFTMSLKNNVGLVAKWEGIYNYMIELHTSPNQRKMIAEINKYVPNNLVIMDGIKGFATGGPDKGNLIEPGVLLLSDDRVAIDAVGVAILRNYQTTKKVARGKVFDQDQLKRAVELGIGAKSPEEIELISLNSAAQAIATKIEF